jgi:hypothetical protein
MSSGDTAGATMQQCITAVVAAWLTVRVYSYHWCQTAQAFALKHWRKFQLQCGLISMREYFDASAVNPSALIHEGVICDSCGCYPMRGTR